MSNSLMVVAIGGNALIRDKQHQTVPDQMAALEETGHHLGALVEDGWRLAIGHGNGPQVGFILRRSELAAHELHEVPLDVCGADSQGAIGYELQQALGHEFARPGLDRQAVTVVTQMEVDRNDPAFANPTKPIGSFLDDEAAARRRADGWTVVKQVLFTTVPLDTQAANGVRVAAVVEDSTPLRQVFDPKHPAAGAKGYGQPAQRVRRRRDGQHDLGFALFSDQRRAHEHCQAARAEDALHRTVRPIPPWLQQSRT